MDDRIHQTIIYGSLYEAFYNKFVNVFDVLEYLLKHKPETEPQREKMCIAYRIVCIFTKEQPINGSHFICLTDNEDYISIYALSFNSHFKNKNNDNFDENLEISKKIQKVLPKLIKETKYSRFFYVLCDIINKVKGEEAMVIAFTRNIRNLIDIENDYTCFLYSDYLEPLENIPNSFYAKNIGERCRFLQQHAPLYWKNVAYNIYYSFVKDKYKNAPNFTKEMIDIYNKSFPDLFSENIINRSETVIAISNLDKNIQSYLLGFPIHKYIPNDSNLNKALDKLELLGNEKYCESIKVEEINVANSENVLSEKIDDFNSFDVVKYYVDGGNTDKHLYRFTRSEFENILKDGKNYYTGEPLPLFIIEKIKCINNIAKKYNLPKSKTLFELLSNVTNYIEESDEDDDEPQRYIVGRARDQETGEESIFRFPILGELDELDTEDLDEVAEEVLNYQGLDFLGRVHCTCPTCNDVFPPEDISDDCIYEDDDIDIIN